MKNNACLKIAAILTAVTLCGMVNAQSMYRCGSVYQDRPCEGNDPGKRIGSTGSDQAAYKPVADSECAQRGADTLKIVWRREAGASAQKQMEDVDAQRSPRGGDQKRLIADVYNKRGSAPEVRAAIEADCMLEKERAAQAAAAGAPPPGKPQSTIGSSPAAGSDADTKTSDARRREEAAAQDAAKKKRRCDDLKTELANIRNSQRSGGDVVEMERLNQKSRDTQGQLNQWGC